MNFSTPIADFEQAKAWIKELHDSDLMFHFEDSPETIINFTTGKEIFTADEAAQVRERVAELYSFDWGADECPIGYALNLEDPNWRTN